MILSVSTIKDSPANVEKFVRRNLAGGIDHLIIYLDAPLPEVEELLTAHPHVTWLPAHGDWWVDGPSARLNERQRINASMTGQLLSDFSWAEWLFHIDGDEVVQLDRGLVDGLGPDTLSVKVATMEAVSKQTWDGEPTWFKRLLDPDQLVLLRTLGLIDRPENAVYFRGHTGGKVGIRPSREYFLGIHRAVWPDGKRVPVFADDSLRLLHYESPDGDEFVRKWRALLSSGDTIRLRSDRGDLAQSLAALLDLGLDEDVTTELLEDLYRRTTLDDFESLRRLGLLEHIDPDAVQRTPEPLSDRASSDLAGLVEQIRTLPKHPFKPPRQVIAEKAKHRHRQFRRGKAADG